MKRIQYTGLGLLVLILFTSLVILPGIVLAADAIPRQASNLNKNSSNQTSEKASEKSSEKADTSKKEDKKDSGGFDGEGKELYMDWELSSNYFVGIQYSGLFESTDEDFNGIEIKVGGRFMGFEFPLFGGIRLHVLPFVVTATTNFREFTDVRLTGLRMAGARAIIDKIGLSAELLNFDVMNMDRASNFDYGRLNSFNIASFAFDRIFYLPNTTKLQIIGGARVNIGMTDFRIGTTLFEQVQDAYNLVDQELENFSETHNVDGFSLAFRINAGVRLWEMLSGELIGDLTSVSIGDNPSHVMGLTFRVAVTPLSFLRAYIEGGFSQKALDTINGISQQTNANTAFTSNGEIVVGAEVRL